MTYVEILHDIESVFAGSEWTDNSIASYPSSFSADIPEDVEEFIQINANPSRSRYNSFSSVCIDGHMIVNIHTQRYRGDRRLFEIADILDNLFLSRIVGDLQFSTSVLNRAGSDVRYPLYNRGEYRINFTEI